MGARASFSRNGSTNPLGKLTAEIPKFKVPEEVKDELEREAAKAGLGLTEFVREICIIRALGKEKVVSLYTERVAVVAGKGSE